jgi:hypothetical protein
MLLVRNKGLLLLGHPFGSYGTTSPQGEALEEDPLSQQADSSPNNFFQKFWGRFGKKEDLPQIVAIGIFYLRYCFFLI